MAAFKLKSDANVVRENAAAAGNVLANDGTAIQVTQVKTSSGAFVTVSPTGVTLQGIYGFLTIMSGWQLFLRRVDRGRGPGSRPVRRRRTRSLMRR